MKKLLLKVLAPIAVMTIAMCISVNAQYIPDSFDDTQDAVSPCWEDWIEDGFRN